MTTYPSPGPEVLLPPAQPPTPHPLPGRTITLLPIKESHTQDLWNVVGGTTDPLKASVWTYLPEGPYPEDTYLDFATSIQNKTTSKDPLFYTILDHRTNKPQGWITLMSIVPEHLRLEIGHVLFAPELQRTTGATEAVYLLLRYAFEELGYRRVEWKCNDLNEGSKRAARRLGWILRTKTRQHTTMATTKTAFLILDVQKGVTGQIFDGSTPGREESYLQRLASVVKAAREKSIHIIHVKTAFRRGFPDLHPRNPSAQRVIPTGKYTEGDDSVELHPAVAPYENDIVTTKRRVSAFVGSDLDVVLRSARIENLVVVGLITSGAVLSTVRQAADLDYRLTVLEDLCLDRDQEVHDVLMRKVIAKQADVEWLASL
ncbi:Isochorismatase-like protein [Aspergillus pseudotamarii]|uniref:Isochorismatase-like protein n=1 Tax=Aspergillus pseudotamarii TaxID=132259 RepID=A0A5N6SU42_ASPPS|nr:Isochorismatase-like protein [Aspergillus pseudotamarii]KAE8138198.1 Isochorismatase-like protein [Aspergillus pseudotamarii]